VIRIEPELFESDRVTLRVEGRLTAADLPVLLDSVESFLARRVRVEIDLAGTRFLERGAACSLLLLNERGVRLERAHGYVRELLRSLEDPP